MREDRGEQWRGGGDASKAACHNTNTDGGCLSVCHHICLHVLLLAASCTALFVLTLM